MAYKGFYKVKNVEKYIGDPTTCYYRSLWERKCCTFFDLNDAVLVWKIEPFFIPYMSPVDNRYHRYFVDFYIKMRDRDGNIQEKIIEVKPKKQTRPPKQPKKVTKRFLKEARTWSVNQAKWEAAETFCKKKGWEFVILTEDNIPTIK